MSDALIIALEASWKNDPVRMENKLWDSIVDNSDEKVCRAKPEQVEKV